MRRQTAHVDPLTGLVQRQELQRRVDELLGRGERIAVLLLDLDRFKEVNDTLGHLAGDALLRELARRLADTIDEHALAARFGGDEFAVLLTRVRDVDDALAAASRIRASLRHPVAVGDVHIELESSIGVALAPDDGRDSARLLHRADVAMYEAKRTQRGVQRYEEAHDPRSDRQLAFASALREAIGNGAIVAHYQPIVRFDGTTVRAEALARWQHPELGLIEPSAFMVGAEQSGVIARLTEYVIDRALADLVAWDRPHDGTAGPLGLAVNLAPANLVDETFPDRLGDGLSRQGVAPERLTLEMRESNVLMLGRARGVVEALHRLGVRLAVDDFGRAPSSLTMLHDLPVQEVKLDGRIVNGVPRRPAACRLTKAVVAAAHALGLEVVAKGVERDDTRLACARLGCDAAQGFRLGRPQPAAELQSSLAPVGM